ncbi:MAG: CBS domain-containing protein, partial [Planctomycetota bacterium]|nr:CBS domain-containing protein [Planctomycetota bacterium]
SLGQRLRYQVKDLQREGEDLPVVAEDATLSEAIGEMSRKGNIGVTLVVAENGELSGILSDGDLRRILSEKAGAAEPLNLETPVKDLMTSNPLTIDSDASAKDALQIMEVRSITSLVVINHLGKPIGLIHLHDILGRGKIVL